jgi:hypothetical protein
MGNRTRNLKAMQQSPYDEGYFVSCPPYRTVSP